LYACGNESLQQKAAIPDVWVAASNSLLKQKDGFLFFNNKKFSGRTYELYPTGDTALLFTYLNGKEEGWCYQWHPGKVKMEERFYSQGKKEGLHKGWWQNGQLKFVYQFTNNEHHGAAKEYNINGMLYRSFNYKEGHEDGLQQMWWEDGRPRANYVVKNGEQYGLIGRKLCKNRNDETK
jgi:antitoxin component YwqK of YwqJK toxin-antitoxin module